MAPQFVKPYVKANQHDVADAEAICEAVSRPSMRFVPVKNPEQQALLALHRARQGFVAARTAQGNPIRGRLAEFGLLVPKGLTALKRRIPEILEDAENGLPGAFRELLDTLANHLSELNRQVEAITQRIESIHRANPRSPPTGPDSRHRPTHRHGTARRNRRPQKFRQRSATGRLAGPGTQAILHRRQNPASWHQQARGHLSPNALRPIDIGTDRLAKRRRPCMTLRPARDALQFACGRRFASPSGEPPGPGPSMSPELSSTENR